MNEDRVYSIGEKINVFHFGRPDKMEIIEFDEKTNKYKCAELGAYGSCWYSEAELNEHQQRVDEYNYSLNNQK